MVNLMSPKDEMIRSTRLRSENELTPKKSLSYKNADEVSLISTNSCNSPSKKKTPKLKV